MTQLIFAVLLSWNMNVGNPFDNFDKTEYGKMLDKFGRRRSKTLQRRKLGLVSRLTRILWSVPRLLLLLFLLLLF